ncbi:plastocyanin/azurin family copper-binding protein [Halobacteria archaeon HArc-gm2]|nr:plastocyanin/azurin family copper-binding protein [Halobacteria archaeon HArc-gm2]
MEGNPQAEVTRIPEGAEGWNGETLTEQGATFSHTFEVEGTYDYYCIPHKSLEMVGRVVVGEPSGLDGNPPDGAVPDEQATVDAGAVSFDEFQSG